MFFKQGRVDDGAGGIITSLLFEVLPLFNVHTTLIFLS